MPIVARQPQSYRFPPPSSTFPVSRRHCNPYGFPKKPAHNRKTFKAILGPLAFSVGTLGGDIAAQRCRLSGRRVWRQEMCCRCPTQSAAQLEGLRLLFDPSTTNSNLPFATQRYYLHLRVELNAITHPLNITLFPRQYVTPTCWYIASSLRPSRYAT
jgi:hypothetical protein